MQETHLNITESVATLRDDLKNLTLDLARLCKEHRDIACAPALLDLAVGVLEQSEALLDEVMGLAPSDGEPVASEFAAREAVTLRRLLRAVTSPESASLAPGAPEAAAPAKRTRRGSHDSKGRTRH